MFKVSFPQNVSPDVDIRLVETGDYKHSIERDSFGNPLHGQVVDQFDAQPFLQGENGFRRNDISILRAAESAEVKEAIASRLVELKDNADFAGMTDEQIAALAVPRYCQTAASVADWQSSLDHGSLAKSVDEWIANEQAAAQKQADIQAKLAELETIKAKAANVDPKPKDE